jgi:hypothetical protein
MEHRQKRIEMKRNYTYASEYAVVIITADSKQDADRTLKETVIHPEEFTWESAERV